MGAVRPGHGCLEPAQPVDAGSGEFAEVVEQRPLGGRKAGDALAGSARRDDVHPRVVLGHLAQAGEHLARALRVRLGRRQGRRTEEYFRTACALGGQLGQARRCPAHCAKFGTGDGDRPLIEQRTHPMSTGRRSKMSHQSWFA